MVQIGAVHLAVFAKNVSDAARDLAADRDPAMAVLHLAAADNEILSRDVDPPAVVITARFYGNAIVAGVEMATFDKYILARFRITAIIVWPVRRDPKVADRDVLAKQR